MAPHPSAAPPPGPEDHAVAEAVQQVQDHAIFRMDLQGRASTWNLGVRTVLGFEKDEFIGADLLPLIWTPEDIASGAAARELETAARHGYAGDDRWMLRKTKERFWAMGTTTAVFDGGREVKGFIKVVRDLTWFKHTQDHLATRTQELAAANDDLRDLVDLVAHDFKEPLRGILFHLQVLDEDHPTSPGQARERTAIRTLIVRLQVLIDSMMEISRAGAGELRWERVSLGVLALDAARQVEGLRAERGGIVQLHPPMPEVVADPVLLSQALTNLISNGLKYNESVPPSVDLSAGEEEGRVVVRVRDNGIGIAPKHRETIFRMFRRLHGREAYGGGAGVGLPLVRKIVERHGGRISVESQEGKGSTFVISLPRPGSEGDGP